jgi:diaminohydroxyphosphoribosylaminopyrimidine deaminase/5-amino-6-(5-phosphoribosylamino)uracil reductase
MDYAPDNPLTPFVVREQQFMDDALTLAALGRGWTSPNPMVGALVVKDDRVIGRGYHQQAGMAHAEVVALDEAGDAARGADLYVTLEPCSHYGRTPPCTDRVVAAGIKRVFCAHVDPDERVNGRGIEILRGAGISVEIGLGEQAAKKLNEHFIHWKTHSTPWLTLKWAQTLDGRVATSTGNSQWITGEEARRHAHRLRSWHDAVLIGVGTALADDPQLNVRMVEGHQPFHVVLDPTLRLSPSARLVTPGNTVILCSESADPDRLLAWQRNEVEAVPIRSNGDELEMEAILEALTALRFQSVFVEGGSRTLTSFLKAGAANRITVFIAPKILGKGIPAIGDLGVKRVDDAFRLKDIEFTRLGDDICVSGLYEGKR